MACMQGMHKMKPKTPIPIVKVDYTKKAWEQTTTALHNRWHPDLPAVSSLSPMITLMMCIMAD